MLSTHRETDPRRSGVRRPDRASGHDRRQIQELADVADSSTRRGPAIAGFVVGAALALAAVLLVVQNVRTVPFEWLVFDADAPMWLLLLASFVAGLLVGPLVIAGARRSSQRRHERREVVERARRA
jgi:uncharacterized integral membrane protein